MKRRMAIREWRRVRPWVSGGCLWLAFVSFALGICTGPGVWERGLLDGCRVALCMAFIP